MFRFIVISGLYQGWDLIILANKIMFKISIGNINVSEPHLLPFYLVRHFEGFIRMLRICSTVMK